MKADTDVDFVRADDVDDMKVDVEMVREDKNFVRADAHADVDFVKAAVDSVSTDVRISRLQDGSGDDGSTAGQADCSGARRRRVGSGRGGHGSGADGAL